MFIFLDKIIYNSEYDNINNNCIVLSTVTIFLLAFNKTYTTWFEWDTIANEAVLHDVANQISAHIINLIGIFSPDVIVIQTYVWTQRQIITKRINALSSRIIDFIFRFVMWGTEFRWFPLRASVVRSSERTRFSYTVTSTLHAQTASRCFLERQPMRWLLLTMPKQICISNCIYSHHHNFCIDVRTTCLGHHWVGVLIQYWLNCWRLIFASV